MRKNMRYLFLLIFLMLQVQMQAVIFQLLLFEHPKTKKQILIYGDYHDFFKNAISQITYLKDILNKLFASEQFKDGQTKILYEKDCCIIANGIVLGNQYIYQSNIPDMLCLYLLRYLDFKNPNFKLGGLNPRLYVNLYCYLKEKALNAPYNKEPQVNYFLKLIHYISNILNLIIPTNSTVASVLEYQDLKKKSDFEVLAMLNNAFKQSVTNMYDKILLLSEDKINDGLPTQLSQLMAKQINRLISLAIKNDKILEANKDNISNSLLMRFSQKILDKGNVLLDLSFLLTILSEKLARRIIIFTGLGHAYHTAKYIELLGYVKKYDSLDAATKEFQHDYSRILMYKKDTQIDYLCFKSHFDKFQNSDFDHILE